ncbi:MAG: hypothetical protein AABN33_29280 [Acidobacteriota bacterium]
MKRFVCLVLAVSAVLLGTEGAAAQTQPQLPKVLWIYREDTKPARGTAHERVERGFAQHWAKNKVDPFLAMEAVSGNATEVMFLSGYDSLAAMEKDYNAFGKAANGPEYEALERQEAELVNSIRSMVAVLRPDLSYKQERLMSILPQSRYFNIETFRVRLGRDADFAAGGKLFRDAFEKMKREQPYVMYQVIMGAPEGTYLLFSPIKSFKDIDDDFANQGALMQAMGEENMKNLMKGTGDIFLSMESNVYAFNPSMSNPSKEFAAADPQFWTPKPMVKRAPAAKKEGAKPAAGGKNQ